MKRFISIFRNERNSMKTLPEERIIKRERVFSIILVVWMGSTKRSSFPHSPSHRNMNRDIDRVYPFLDPQMLRISLDKISMFMCILDEDTYSKSFTYTHITNHTNQNWKKTRTWWMRKAGESMHWKEAHQTYSTNKNKKKKSNIIYCYLENERYEKYRVFIF